MPIDPRHAKSWAMIGGVIKRRGWGELTGLRLAAVAFRAGGPLAPGRGVAVVLVAIALALGGAAGCGKGASQDKAIANQTPAGGDAGAGSASDAAAVPALLPLGKSDLAGFAYSRGAGKAAFRRGIEAEKAGDSSASAAAAAEALLADPGHLEAHWLLALSYARLGRYAEVTAPLSAAVAGDYLRWGDRALSDEALTGYLATAPGTAWRALHQRYEAAYRDALGRALLVIGRRGPPWLPSRTGKTSINHRSELYGWIPEGGRYVRLSRTDASLVAVVRATGAPRLAYLSYSRVFVPSLGELAGAYLREVQIGELDLASGTMSAKEVVLKDASSVELRLVAGAQLWEALVHDASGQGVPERLVLDLAKGTSVAAAAAPAGPATAAVRVGYRRVEPVVETVPSIEADWDGGGLASALRLTRSQKTVAAPVGTLFDGRTVSFSPDGTAMAIATAPLDHCSESAADRQVQLLIIDVASGQQRVVAELEGDPAPVLWQRDRLAYVEMVEGEPTVRIVDPLTGGELARLATKGGVCLTRWVDAPACAPAASPETGPGDDADREPDRLTPPGPP